MKYYKCLFSLFSIMLVMQSLHGQTDSLLFDPVPQTDVEVKDIKFDYKPVSQTSFKASRLIVPLALITSGLAIYQIDGLHGADTYLNEQTQKWNIKTKADDFIIFAPGVALFGLDLCGVKAKNNLKDRLIVSGSSCFIGASAVHILKIMTTRYRPDGSASNSFPSGHTQAAFVGAHLLMKEYGHISPWISVSGYAVASGVGFIRMVNNRHWFSDTLMGAGIGILSVEVGYVLLPIISNMVTFGDKKSNALTLSPSFDTNALGVGATWSF